MANADNPIISIRLARKLFDLSHNSDSVVPTLKLDFKDLGSADALQFVGTALKCNTSISWLTVDLQGKDFPVDRMKELLCFVSESPSLKALDVIYSQGDTDSSETARLLLLAAARNKGIEKIRISRDDNDPPKRSTLDVKDFSTLKELEVPCDLLSNLVESWPEHSSISIFRLGYDSDSDARKQQLRSQLFAKLAKGSGSNIRHLDVVGWNANLPSFLFSPHSALDRLELSVIDFSHSEDTGSSLMDGLLHGLFGSKTTTALCFYDCDVDSLAIQKLVQGMKSSMPGIKEMGFHDSRVLTGSDLGSIMECGVLDAMSIEEMDEMVDSNAFLDSINKGIEEGGLSSFRVTTRNLARFLPSLKIACTTGVLSKLELFHCEFDDQGTDGQVSLLEDTTCNLQTLTVIYGNQREWELVHRVVLALNANTNLRNIRLEDHYSSGGVFTAKATALLETLGKAANLLGLEILCQETMPLNQEGRLEAAVSANWSLEQLWIAQTPQYSSTHYAYMEPAITPALQKKLKALTQRNKESRKMLSTPPNSVSNQDKVKWIGKLETFWTLPDGLTLTFRLFQHLTGCFF